MVVESDTQLVPSPFSCCYVDKVMKWDEYL